MSGIFELLYQPNGQKLIVAILNEIIVAWLHF